MEQKNDELMHYGVLGMHWGVRRYQPYSTTGPRKGGATGKEIGAAAKVKSRITKTGKKIDKLSSKSVSDKPKAIQRRMNQIEKQTVANIYESRQSAKRLTDIEKKATKLMTKATSRKNGPTARDVKKAQKLETKVDKEEANYKAANANVKKGESETWKLMAKAAEKGYNVTSKQKGFYQENGQLLVAMLLAGYPGGIGYMAMRGQDAFETGNRYKVGSNSKYGSGSSPYQRQRNK